MKSLIPIKFRRRKNRRVYYVDVGNLSVKEALALMAKMRDQFKEKRGRTS